MSDPYMQVRIYHHGMAEALSYELSSMGIYQEVYLDENRYYPKLKKGLNSFLETWLVNLKNQGFYS